ncbi:MAG: amino acid ABC transporter permease, partial [Erysipelotrichaceae bacterium]|nr:amino acid ABC transporter permease [Erysipelotrichaceae bacterium]
QWNSRAAGMVVISLNTGAYMAEIIRSGIQSIDGGQLEACKSIGMSFFQSLVYVIMPQAIKNAFPSIGNEFVVNIKDTSVLNVIAITELYFQTVSIAGSNFKYIETYFITACVYLFLTTVATTVLNFVEKKLDVAESSNRKMIVESH